MKIKRRLALFVIGLIYTPVIIFLVAGLLSLYLITLPYIMTFIKLADWLDNKTRLPN